MEHTKILQRQQRGNFEEAKSLFLRVSLFFVVANKTYSVPRFVDAAQNKRIWQTIRKDKIKPHLTMASPKLRALTLPRSFLNGCEKNAYGIGADQQLYGETQITLKNAVQ